MLKSTNLATEYIEHIEKGDIPVLTCGREDLVKSLNKVNEIYVRKESYDIADNILFVSQEQDLYPINLLTSKLAKKEVKDVKACENNDSIILVGLHQDFTFDKIGRAIMQAKQKQMQVFVLLGRDLPSLSFFVAKQFLTLVGNENKALLFSHERMSKAAKKEFIEQARKLDYTVLLEQDMKKFDFIEYADNTVHKRIIINTHGKEDHVNLGDYTICGLNKSCNNTAGLGRPRCGYGRKNCFKDDKKVIDVKSLCTEELILLSCSNSPYQDSQAYDSKYNLLLNSIDGVTKNIIGATIVHVFMP